MKEMEERELREEDLKKAIEEAWAKRLQLPVDRFVSKERFLMADEAKKGKGELSHLSFEKRTVILYDPELETVVKSALEEEDREKLALAKLLHESFSLWKKTSIKYLNPSNYVPYDPPMDFVVRRLNQGDRTAFYRFRNQCTREDLAEGFVELDHVVVFGAFYEEEIVAVSSIIEWDSIADIGIITMPDFRELGLGKAIGSRASEWAIVNKKLIQYRHDVLNYGSLKVSRALGFREYILEQDYTYIG
jgi:RimJ/RimL family protein N-acetyltransferase